MSSSTSASPIDRWYLMMEPVPWLWYAVRISVDTSFSPSIKNSWIRMRQPAYIRGVIAPSTFSTAVSRQNHGER